VGNHRRQLLAKIEIKNLSFDEEALAKLNESIAQLEELQQAYPGVARFGYEDSHTKAATAEIYLNGELTVDFPEDAKISVELNQMVSAELVGSSLKLNYCGLENAMPFGLAKPIAFLNEQYAVGSAEVKILRS
jgi:inner membrane protein